MKHLFVGGYADGTMRDVPDEYASWNVPVPLELETFTYATSDDDILDMRVGVHNYKRRTVFMDGHLFDVFALDDGEPRHIGPALLKAAGVI